MGAPIELRSAPSALLMERMTRQGLATRPCATPAEAAAVTTAIQAQDPPASQLGLRSRAVGITEADVVSAVADTRTVVRTWLMRGTVHLVAAADYRWLVDLIGPSIAGKYRTRWRQLGLSDDFVDRIVAALPDVLAGAPRTRTEIRDALIGCGVPLPTGDPQATTHAVLAASTTGLICRGPQRGRDATFVLADDWLTLGDDAPTGPTGDDALAELARRYFAAYSPATAADFATWSGLPARRAVELIRDELAVADVDGRPGYRYGDVEPCRGTRLLARFDNYLIGYRDRTAMLAPGLHPRVYVGGIIKPVVVRDGRVLGLWELDRARRRISVTPFEPLDDAVRRAVDEEADDIARFIGLELRATILPVA